MSLGIFTQETILLGILQPLSPGTVQVAVVKPTWKARKELKTAIWLAPIVSANLSLKVFELVICTDASIQGYGVVYCRSSNENQLFLHKSSETEWGNWISMQRWKIAIKHKWNKMESVHVLEAKAVQLGLEWFLRSSMNRN